jgi:autotransporter-associated beta strand protein
VFNPGASAFTISVIEPPTLRIDGVGIVNNSGVVQNFVCDTHSRQRAGLIAFTGSASAGSQCVFTSNGSADAGASTSFLDSASAGTSTFIANGGFQGVPGNVTFSGNATAANGTFIANGGTLFTGVGGEINFHDSSTAAGAVLMTLPGDQDEQARNGTINFYDSSSAGNCAIINYGPQTDFLDNFTRFSETSTAANAHITNTGSANDFEQGGVTAFSLLFGETGGCTGGNATIVNEGGKVPFGYGGLTSFSGSCNAGSAIITNEGGVAGAYGGGLTLVGDTGDAAESTLIANGGPDLPSAGAIRFELHSVGGTARVILSGNANLDVSNQSGTLTIGSIEGEGEVYLGAHPHNLSIGSNNLSTELAAIVQDGGAGGGTGGHLTKLGTGVLTLTVANTYTGGTRVSGGGLIIANPEGSGTGTGDVIVASGTLGGSGTIAGAVTIGTGAFLAPAGGTQTKATLTIESSLTFSSTATYTYTFRGRRSRAEADKVVANGVTINSNASFNLSGKTQGALTQGLVLTIIDNTALTPIAGTFSNLPDGAIVNVNGNNLQASYSGGDGNDLTLTVVP